MLYAVPDFPSVDSNDVDYGHERSSTCEEEAVCPKEWAATENSVQIEAVG